MFYFVKTPWWLQKIYHEAIWKAGGKEHQVYLTFDDGPHPRITPYVLDCLKQYQAKATFFCIGNNVRKYPAIYHQVIEAGHRVGNHTEHHLNGWKATDEKYLQDIAAAAGVIDSNLFRPPYGRIRKSQLKRLADLTPAMKTIMWDVLSGDFDLKLNSDQCIRNVIRHTSPGSIIVFHDSEKAFPRLEKTLPAVLENLSKRGFRFDVLT